MARIRVTMSSAAGDSMLMHNERLSDPLNPYTRWLSELTGKTKKTEADHEEIARREFLGSGYWLMDDGPGGTVAEPVIPTWNIVRCLQAGATRQKLGKHVVRGLVPQTMTTPLVYDGPRNAAEMWKSGLFHNRKGVVIGGRRTMRTRPCFTDWSVTADLEIDLTILDPDKVDQIARDAGKYEGLGDNRPVFGRFIGSAVLLSDAAEFVAPDALTVKRVEAAVGSARARVAQIDAVHAENHPNGKARAKRVRAAVGKP